MKNVLFSPSYVLRPPSLRDTKQSGIPPSLRDTKQSRIPPSLRGTKQSRIFTGLLRRLAMTAVCILLFSTCSGGKTKTGAIVVATSSWTAAYAQAAGAENVVVLAPYTMAHPSEYELRPGDIPKLMEATVIVYAGYEVMTERLTKGLDLPPEKLLLVETEYNYTKIAQSVMELATLLGTVPIARENLLEIRSAFEDGRKAVKEKKWTGQKVVVHRFLAPLAQELGLNPVVIFGPGAPEVLDIVTVSKSNAFIIMDNRHNPVGLPLRKSCLMRFTNNCLTFPDTLEPNHYPT